MTLAMLNSTEIMLISGVFGFILLLTLFWLWAMVHCARRISAGETTLVGWMIVICLAHALGAAAYFLFGRSRAAANLPR